MGKKLLYLLIAIVCLSTGIGVSNAAFSMQWPVNGSVITPFGLKGEYEAGSHRGIDIAGEPGTEVVAPADGHVVFAGKNTLPGSGGGMILTLEHENDVSTTYLGIDNVAVKKGQFVQKGDRIAVIGSSGDSSSSTLPHLHFGAYATSKKNEGFNRYLDPATFLTAVMPDSDNDGSQVEKPVAAQLKPAENASTVQRPAPSGIKAASPSPVVKAAAKEATVRTVAAKDKKTFSNISKAPAAPFIAGPAAAVKNTQDQELAKQPIKASKQVLKFDRQIKTKPAARQTLPHQNQNSTKDLKSLAAHVEFGKPDQSSSRLSLRSTVEGQVGETIGHEEKVVRFFEYGKWIVVQMVLAAGLFAIVKLAPLASLKPA